MMPAAVELCERVGSAAIEAISASQLLEYMEEVLFEDVLSSSDPSEIPPSIADALSDIYWNLHNFDKSVYWIRCGYRRMILESEVKAANPLAAAIFILEEAVGDNIFDFRDAVMASELPWNSVPLVGLMREFPDRISAFLHESDEGYAPIYDDSLLNEAKRVLVHLKVLMRSRVAGCPNGDTPP